MMKLYEAHLESVTPYSQGRHHLEPKNERESAADHDRRTYLHRLHTSIGKVYIPPMAFKLCLTDTASYLGMQIPGKGKATYTKHFRQGVMVNEPVMLDIAPEDTRLHPQFTSLEPQKKNGPRGWRHFPVIDHWEGVLQVLIIDEIITKAVLEQHLKLAGMITGIGVWRPQNQGMWGKFKLLELAEKEVSI